MKKKRLSSKRRRRLKRKCSECILGEDELLSLMMYFVESVIHSKKSLNNARRDMVYRTLFALSSSREMFSNEAKPLFAKYLFETQFYAFGSFHICNNNNIDDWGSFQYERNVRICLCMKWNQVISICVFVVRDSNEKYRIHFMNETEAKRGYIDCTRDCTAILNFKDKNAVVKFVSGMNLK